MSRYQRALAAFMSACPSEWAERHLFNVLLGVLCRTDAEFERDFFLRTAEATNFLREAIRAKSIALIFDGSGTLRAHASIGPLADGALSDPEPRMSARARFSAGEDMVAWTLFAKDRLGFDQATLRGIMKILQDLLSVCEIRHPAKPGIARTIRFRRRPPAAQAADGPGRKHVLLTMSNIAQLFHDDAVCPNGFFSELEYDAALGNLLSLTSTTAGHFESLSTLEIKVRLRQYHIHRMCAGPGDACLTWAWVSSHTLQRLRRRPNRPLSIFEVNDGEHLLLDAVVPGPFACSDIFQVLKDGPFAGIQEAYLRIDGRVMRVALDDPFALDLVGQAMNAPSEQGMTWNGIFDEFQ